MNLYLDLQLVSFFLELLTIKSTHSMTIHANSLRFIGWRMRWVACHPNTQGEHCSKEEPRAGDHVFSGKKWNKQGDIWQGVWYRPLEVEDLLFVWKLEQRCRMTWWHDFRCFPIRFIEVYARFWGTLALWKEIAPTLHAMERNPNKIRIHSQELT